MFNFKFPKYHLGCYHFKLDFKISKLILKNNTYALFSILLLECLYFYNFTTPEFNVNVCQLPFWSLTVYYSWKIYKNNKINFIDCLLVGLFAGFGFLSKYLFIYLLISIDLLFIYLIFIKKNNGIFKTIFPSITFKNKN